MFKLLDPFRSVKISNNSCCSFYFCNNRFEGAIFLRRSLCLTRNSSSSNKKAVVFSIRILTNSRSPLQTNTKSILCGATFSTMQNMLLMTLKKNMDYASFFGSDSDFKSSSLASFNHLQIVSTWSGDISILLNSCGSKSGDSIKIIPSSLIPTLISRIIRFITRSFLFSTLVCSKNDNGLPLPMSTIQAYGGSFFSRGISNENQTVMSGYENRNVLNCEDSLTTSSDSKALFLNNFKIFFNNGITQIKNGSKGVLRCYQHLSRYTPSSITPSNGEGGMVMVLEQIEIPLSRATTKAKNRFGKRQIKSFEQWKLDRALKSRQERIAEHRRMIQGWLL